MKRKLFIKNIGLSIGTLIIGPFSEIFSKPTINVSKLRLGSFDDNGNLVKISGKFLDAKTLKPITADISIKKANKIVTLKDKIVMADSFEILNDLGGEFSEKLNFKITSKGYKPLEGQLFISKSSVNIDSNIWQYNPDFKSENRPNQHKIENGILLVNFDFELVKK